MPEELGYKDEDLKHFCSGILLHDIGMTRISAHILNKKGKLTKEEYARGKKTPGNRCRNLKRNRKHGFTEEYMITLQHHENYDGTGYPRGLKKDEILRCGRIARIIDVYDALTTIRPYAEAMRPFAALVEMKDNMLNCFDKELLVSFIRFFGPSDPRAKQRKSDILQN